MKPSELYAWQMVSHADVHKDRCNLLAHIVLVPLFLLTHPGLFTSLAFAVWWTAAVWVGVVVLYIALRGRGDAFERCALIECYCQANAIARLLVKRWLTFPRLVISGGGLVPPRSSVSTPPTQF